MRYWIVGAILGLMVMAGFGGWWLSQNGGLINKSIPLQDNEIQIEVQEKEKAEVSISALDSAEETLRTIEATDKPGKISIFIENQMPVAISETFASLQGSTFGENGEGAACGFPIKTKNGANLSIYITAKKMIDKFGVNKFETDLNDLVKYCLAYTALGSSLPPNELATNANKYAQMLMGKYVTIKL